MHRTIRIGAVAAFATMVSVAAWAAAGADQENDHPRRERRIESPAERDSMFERHVAGLKPEEQRLARAMRPLRDSMMRLTREYRRKAKDGADPRSLAPERAAIVELDARIQTVRAENREAWLDMLARPAGPGEGDQPRPHRGPHGKGGRPEAGHGRIAPDGGAPPPDPDCPAMHEDGPPPPAEL